MEKSTRNDYTLNGKSISDAPTQNGIGEEPGMERKHAAPVSAGSGLNFKREVGQESRSDFVNGSLNAGGWTVGDNFAKSAMLRSLSLVAESLYTPKSEPDANSLPGAPEKNEKSNVSGVENTAAEAVSETGTNLGTLPVGGWKMDVDRDDKDGVSIRPLLAEFDNESRLHNDTSEDSRLLEDRPTGCSDDPKDSDVRIDGCLVDFKSLSCDIESSGVDSRKSHRSKTPDSLRPLARLLHDIGLELVRQLVYKDLIDIQEAKDTLNKLEDQDRTQLARLTEAHSKLRERSEAYCAPVRSCRCGFKCSSANVMALHQEFGRSVDQFPHVCCCCDDFRSKWPSQFVAHMETAHDSKARVQKKPATYVCFFCAYEHKNWMKIEMHMAKCANKFSLSGNLQPQPADCDIPVLYKPGQVAQRIYPMNPPPTPCLPGRFLATSVSVAPSPPAAPTQATPPPPPITPTPATGQSSVMEIDGQLYSLVNHNGKVLLTSLRSQIGSPSAASGSPATPSTSGAAKKVPFPPPATTTVARAPKPPTIKPVVPVTRETCEICGVVVTSREALWTHFRDVHRVELSRTSMREQEPWMKCTFCSVRFWTYQGLARHSSSHHNRSIAPLPQGMNQSRPTRCHLCGHNQTSNPLSHFSAAHGITLLDMYQGRQCCMCNRRLKQSRAFEEHMIVQHRDIFANAEVLHTVIQALSTAHYLKNEDGVLQRPPLMVQQLQQNVSVAGTSKTSSTAKAVSGTPSISDARTVSTGVPTTTRTVSSSNMFLGTRTSLGANAGSSTRTVSHAGVSPGARTFSHANVGPGMKMLPGVVGTRNVSTMRNMPFIGSFSGGKLTSTYMRGAPVFSKSTPSVMQSGGKGSVRPPDFKRPKPRPDSTDRVKPLEQSQCSAKKSREDEQKDLSKLFNKLSDMGRPILRSLRHKGSIVEGNCGEEARAGEGDGPARKKPRLDSQEGPCGADIPGTSLYGTGQAPEFASKIVGPLARGKDC